MNKSSLKSRDLVSSVSVLLSLLVVFVHVTEAASYRSDKKLPLDGSTSFIDGHVTFLIPPFSPGESVGGRPWVWYAPALPGLPGPEERWMFEQFVAAGISIAGIDVGESYGSPAGRKLFSAFHAEMIRNGFSAKPVLLGRSRGGLMALSWAVENPDRLGGFAGIYPVCNVASYPGLAKAAPAYGMTVDELQNHLHEHNPVDRLTSLARARVPLFAVHGDVDKVVPLADNSGLLRDRYAALGESVQLIVPPGQGHNMWSGFFKCQELMDFVKAHTGPNITINSPQEFSVVQRDISNEGSVRIAGSLAGFQHAQFTLEARLLINHSPLTRWPRDSKQTRWRRLPLDEGKFEDRWDVPAGGWHRLEVRARSGTNLLAESFVEYLGVGEIFVIAGQSNSANHGAERYIPTTGLVTAFEGTRWQMARDPQPGASGDGGSFIPPFADAIVERFQVPVGVIACGVGATSVREWLPKGIAFPNPPTITNHVIAQADGQWQSNGEIFTRFTSRMKQVGPKGFRAVLWHQGESDANQADPSRTLAGDLYREHMKQLIERSRQEIGWSAPWFVAQVSYHNPEDTGSAEIRAAQAGLWREGIALEGPDTDALQGHFRDNNGQGVHFSAVGLREHAARWFEKVAPWMAKRTRN